VTQTLEFLSRQKDTFSSIRGLVHTMKILAAINATPYEQAAQSIQAYHQVVLQGFAAFAKRSGQLKLEGLTGKRKLMLVYGSDHGLCGSYNENLAQMVKDYCQSTSGHDWSFLCVGARMQAALADLGLIVDQVLLPPASAEGIGRLAADLVKQIEAFGHGQQLALNVVALAFTERAEQGLNTAVIRNLLPLDTQLLDSKKTWDSRSLPDYSMAPETLLASLIRNHIYASVFSAAAEAMVTENAARLALMQQAEKSVDERLEVVETDLRYVRQTEITNEIMDIIVGYL